MLPGPLAPLAAWPQFVAWRLEWAEERQVWIKVPYSPKTGHRASSTNPADWGTYEQAAALPGMDGVGFVFTEADPFFFLDVDKCLVAGQWSQLAQELCARFPGAAVEISQSGTGLHVIGSYTSVPEHGCRNTVLGIELYTTERFVALTGNGAIGSVSTDHTPALAAAIGQYFTPTAKSGLSAEWTTAPDPEWSGPADDMELLERALRSQSSAAAFGDAVTFAELWAADADALGKRWPGGPGQAYNASQADQSLANALAFWTGRDCERMDRMMRMSGLMRAKWDMRDDYLPTTILKARAFVTTVYKSGGHERPVPPPPAPAAIVAAGFQPRGANAYAAFDDQLRLFQGCVYVSGPHKILTPRGELLDQGRFNAVYGGYEYVLSADGKKTTTSAWDAFTLAQTFEPLRADRLCFRPENPAGIIEDAGLRLANTYVPINTPTEAGDPRKYLELIERHLPIAADREILLNYMASVVRNPGMKAQWWPVIQGAEGNGKTIHLNVMMYCIGSRYAHLPNTSKMIRNGMNFNGWIYGKLFVGLEEVYAPDRRAFFEEFKTTVTNRFLPIEGKGIEETTGDNRANGIITSNYRDGVPIDDTKRRYAALFTAQQDPADLTRDDMTPRYFSDLYDWLFGRNAYASQGADYGFRVINNFLRTYPLVAELDPNQFATRAPVTSSMGAAVEASRGQIEQDVLEAIGEDVPGFAGGWISSIKLDELLERRRARIPRNKRRDMLRSIGYDWHPALEANQGRVNNVVMPDNSKPRLFCKIGSIAWLNLTDAASVAKAYSDAQAKGMTEKTTASFG